MPELVSTVNGRDDEASPESALPAGSKTCPDCAEEVRVAARKCRFCGYAFEETESATWAFSTPAAPRAQSRRRWTSTGSLAVAAVVLGGLAILSGFGGNSAVLLLGIVAVGLGVWARVQNKRGPALCGIALAAFSLLGYVGNLCSPVLPSSKPYHLSQRLQPRRHRVRALCACIETLSRRTLSALLCCFKPPTTTQLATRRRHSAPCRGIRIGRPGGVR